MNHNIRAIKTDLAINSWFSLRIDMMSILLMAIISTGCVLLRQDVSQQEFDDKMSRGGLAEDTEVMTPILLSILLSYVLTIQTTLVWVLKYYVQIESNMINAERCMQLTRIIQEKEICQEAKADLPPDWPLNGEIEFREVQL